MGTRSRYISNFVVSSNDIANSTITYEDIGTVYTGNIIEVTNLYYTNARVRSTLTSGNGISYNTLLGNITLSPTGVSAGSYGNSTLVPQFIVDAYGRITSASNVQVTGSGVTNFYSTANVFTIVTSTGNLTANLNIETQAGMNVFNDGANNKIVLSFLPGGQGYTVDFGLVSETTGAISYDFGTL